MFSICNNPEATVKECWTDQGWDLSFRRLLANLLPRLEDFTGTTPNPDSMKWKHNKDGIFSVKRAYETEEEEARARRDGGKSSHIAFGGLYGMREIVEALKIGPISFTQLNGIVLYLTSFGVKRWT
ncbi:hypothetical protein MTR67_020016 [Solanum verrucosum]|uniref:Uncharacterized protein n=1 Tax=Solanum verrucosum TaxID=315347 RepID=A0AAF0TNS6_SOLVR|nr:hypothetical protein MTR67_020016 [Solanum verrucosum]